MLSTGYNGKTHTKHNFTRYILIQFTSISNFIEIRSVDSEMKHADTEREGGRERERHDFPIKRSLLCSLCRERIKYDTLHHVGLLTLGFVDLYTCKSSGLRCSFVIHSS